VSDRIVRAEVWAVVGRGEIEQTAPIEGESLIKMEVICSPTFLQYLRDEDDVLLNFSTGYVRVKRADFLRALGNILPDILQASFDREEGGKR
jgi:hypothetical protein